MSIYEEDVSDLDVALDSLDALPEFTRPPVGVTISTMKNWEKKKIKDSDWLVINFQFKQAIEVESEIPENSEFSIMYRLVKTEAMKYDPRAFIMKTFKDTNKNFGEVKLSGLLNRLVGRDLVLLIETDKNGWEKLKKVDLA